MLILSFLRALYSLLKDKGNLYKTLWVNSYYFSFKEAMMLPIFVYGKTDITNHTGKILLECPAKTGLIKIGRSYSGIYGRYTTAQTRFAIDGKLILKGNVNIAAGCKFVIRSWGTVTLGKDFWFSPECKLCCRSTSITIGDGFISSWESQIFDSNFHYIIYDDSYVKYTDEPVYIGNNVWVGNRVTIMKGTKINNKCIVAANSLVNKNFLDEGECCLFAGAPAILTRKNVQMFRTITSEWKINNYFRNNPGERIFNLLWLDDNV